MQAKKTVLITGCSSGIGLYCANELQKAGFQVIASARKAEDVVTLENQGLTAIQLDLASSDSINDGVSAALDIARGSIYGLFNNGAFGQPGAVEDLSRELLRTSFETNLFGTHELTCKIIPSMREAGMGRIIQNSSVLGLVGLPYRGAYNASKFALEGLTDTMRIELRDSGIQVSLIEPGPITSRFRENALALFQKNINVESSAHRNQYEGMLKRLTKVGPSAPGTLGPEAVYKKLLHALTSKRARPRYYVTYPTYLLGTGKRLFSTGIVDAILAKISRDENS